MHIRGDDKLVAVRIGYAGLVQLFGYYADKPAAVFVYAPGSRPHKAGISAAEHHADAPLCKEGAGAVCGLKIGGVSSNVPGSCAKPTNINNINAKVNNFFIS